MKKALIFLVFYIFMLWVFMGIITMLLPPPWPLIGNNINSYSFLIMILDLFIILFVYFVLKIFDKKPLAGYFTMPSAGIALLSVIGLLLLNNVVNIAIELVKVPINISANIFEALKTPISIATICVIAPIASELTFRRGILGSLLESKKFHKYALIISTVFFAIVATTPVQVVSSFFIGLFFGWLYIRTNSLVLPLLGNIIYNTVNILPLFFFDPIHTFRDMLGSTAMMLIVLAASAILLVPVVLVLNRKLPHCTQPVKEDVEPYDEITSVLDDEAESNNPD